MSTDSELRAKIKEYEAAIAVKDAALMESGIAIEKFKRLVEKLMSAPNGYATVIQKIFGKGKNPPKLVVYSNDKYLEVNVPGKDEKEVKKFFDLITVGSVVKMTPETSQPFDIVEGAEALGSIAVVSRVLDRHAEVEDTEKGGTRMVLLGKTKVRVGDRVLMDTHGLVVMQNLGKDDEEHSMPEDVNVPWESIGALGEAVATVRAAVEDPFIHSKIYKLYGKEPTRGILVWGPAGNGKTLIGKAMATSVRRIFGKEGQKIKGRCRGFVHISGPSILDKWVGNSEAKVRGLFATCAEHEELNGYPAILFIDEAEGILKKRGTGISTDIQDTIVGTFLACMDGMSKCRTIVVLATNFPEKLDEAVIRPGRIDQKVYVGRPKEEGAREVFKIHLGKTVLAEGVDPQEMAKAGASKLYDENKVLYQIEKKSGEKVAMTVGSITSGAMIANVVSRATERALRRDIATGGFKGVDHENLSMAIDDVVRENRTIYHAPEIDEFVAPFKGDVKGVHKVRA